MSLWFQRRFILGECPFGGMVNESSSIKHQAEHLQTVEKRATKARWTNPRQRLQSLMHVEPPRKLRQQICRARRPYSQIDNEEAYLEVNATTKV